MTDLDQTDLGFCANYIVFKGMGVIFCKNEKDQLWCLQTFQQGYLVLKKSADITKSLWWCWQLMLKCSGCHWTWTYTELGYKAIEGSLHKCVYVCIVYMRQRKRHSYNWIYYYQVLKNVRGAAVWKMFCSSVILIQECIFEKM